MPAASLLTPAPFLREWTFYSAEVKCDLTAHAFIHGGKVVLIDPVSPTAELAAALRAAGTPVLIIASNANHDREIAAWKALLGIPVAASALAVKSLGLKPDVVLEGVKNLHGLHPLPLPDAAAGEHAFFAAQERLLIFGDAVVHLPSTGLSLLPDKYCANPAQLRQALAQLTPLDFDALAFAHGPAIVGGAKARWKTLLGAK